MEGKILQICTVSYWGPFIMISGRINEPDQYRSHNNKYLYFKRFSINRKVIQTLKCKIKELPEIISILKDEINKGFFLLEDFCKEASAELI